MTAAVSVVVPVHGTVAYLREAVESALGQGVEGTEIVVADDGSGLDVRGALQGVGGEEVRVLDLPHGGAARARNGAIAASSGEFVAFLDADDAWEPGKLARQVALLRADDRLGLCFANIRVLDADGRRSVYGGRAAAPDDASSAAFVGARLGARYRFLGRTCVTSGVVARRAALVGAAEGGHPFDESMRVMEDVDLWARVADRWRVAYIPEPLVLYRRHAGGLHLRHADYALNVRRFAEKALARHPGDEPFRRAIDRFLGDALSRTGLSCLRRSDAALARRILSGAVAADRLAWRAWAGLALSYLPVWPRPAANGGGR